TLHRAARGAVGYDPMAIEVVQLKFDVWVPIPIQPDGMLAVAATLHEIVVEIEIAIAIGEFPRAPAALPAAVVAAHDEEVFRRDHAIVFSEPLVIAAILAGQEAADLSVGSVIIEVAARRRSAAGGKK